MKPPIPRWLTFVLVYWFAAGAILGILYLLGFVLWGTEL